MIDGPDDVHLGPPASVSPADEAERLLSVLEGELNGSARACRAHGAGWSPVQSAVIFESIAARLRQAAGDLADLAGRVRDARPCD